MSQDFDNQIPSEGDTVRVTNTETGNVVTTGTVQTVQLYGPDRKYGDSSDNAVYMKIQIEPDNMLLFKWGYWDGEQYSWAKKTNYGGPEVSVGQDCFEYTIVS